MKRVVRVQKRDKRTWESWAKLEPLGEKWDPTFTPPPVIPDYTPENEPKPEW